MKLVRFIMIPAVLFLLAGMTPRLFAQWEPDVRLTFNDSASVTSWNNARSITAEQGGFVHVIWYDFRDGNSQVYYKRSTDGGTNWSLDTCLTNEPSPYGAWWPSIASSGPNLHIVWISTRNDDAYYMRSTDNGSTWEPECHLSNGDTVSEFPSLSVTGQNVYLAWDDLRDGNKEIYFKRSTDNGATWTSDTRLTFAPWESEFPSIISSGSDVHVVWRDWRAGNYIPAVYYKRSTDNGISWNADTCLVQDSLGGSDFPQISVSGPFVHVVWEDARDGDYEIYYKRSTDFGVSWQPDIRLTYAPGLSLNPSISGSGPNVHVVWYDNRDGNNSHIYYKRSTDFGVSWSQDTSLTSGIADSWVPFIAVSGTAVHVAWADRRDGNYEIYYKRNLTGNSGVEMQKVLAHASVPPLSVYPNPFTSFAKIPGHSTERFALYDISGRRVGTYKGDRIGEGLAAGVYFLRAESEDGKPVRVVKVR
jgi:hypothetical protein